MDVEHEICGNCKKEIPQQNYLMHGAHCIRNITLCQQCKEPIPKHEFEKHSQKCVKKTKKPTAPPSQLESSQYFQQRKAIEDKKVEARRQRQLEKLDKLVGPEYTLKKVEQQVGHTSRKVEEQVKVEEKKKVVVKKSTGLLACKFCDLELEKLELEEHENYCGSRTDKCLECGELVMFKYKQIHMDSNHGFLKLNDEPGPRPSWDSSTQRNESSTRSFNPLPRGNILEPGPSPSWDSPLRSSNPSSRGKPKEKGESYKEISRRLDCKTEYIRNLLHDSASITVPLRHNGAIPRNHFNHNKGPAPLPPRRRPNPPTELTIPCEFCNVPVPHEDLIQHETGCRPDLARFNPRRRRSSPELDEFFTEPAPTNSEDELPCEFCADMIPASQLWRHQLDCA